ncbi:MAG TPA: hypothetical protein VFM56_10590 [Solimonas sp.]|nr:hypothetical protein [Solimonas sp.]
MSLTLDYSVPPVSFSDPLILTGDDSLFSGSAPSADSSSVLGFLNGIAGTALNTYAAVSAIKNGAGTNLPAANEGNPNNMTGPAVSSGISSSTVLIVGALIAAAIGAAVLLRK